METSRKSSTARVLAVAALAATALVLIVIVSSSGGGSSSNSGGSTASTQKKPKVVNGTKLGNFWTVRPNQTLSTIAVRTGVSVERLQTLNPNVDPQTLHEGERIRIKQKP